ncbi:PhoH family protein [Herbaspirillum huttiense]|uniref:PhoH family protein n=1 Tax=Herbaspirillum huttiense subsp. lycopersici TaxID=3074428 RepID=A0ABU2EGI8_9BURK|nr:PhoH family protein [Herbaspirillum huttiense]MDR9846995.1 PhoH family protein [Herbaspirillum huttiense SE1]
MPKSDRMKGRAAKRGAVATEFTPFDEPARPVAVKPFEPRTEKQRRYVNAMRHGFMVTFGIGPAGTGKTYAAGCVGAELLRAKKVEKIILTRPAVEAGGEKLGYLPGEKEQKFDPYFDPFREVLEERLGKSFVEMMIKAGRIKCEPFAYMRGKTFKNAFVILDEAQNATKEQFKLFLTRIGEGSKVVIDGDETQSDVGSRSGLIDAVERLEDDPEVRVIEFEEADIVRHDFVQRVVKAYTVRK